MKISKLQREVLEATDAEEVFRMDRPPYTAYMIGRRRAITSSVHSLSVLGLIRIGDRRGRGVSYYKLTDAGRKALEALSHTEEG